MTILRRFCAVFVLFVLSGLVSVSISSAATVIRDSELEAGLEYLSADLARAAGFKDGISIRIIIDPSYNAFVAGGKTVYIYSGLLLKARSAEEILGVIAHEIGHLAAGHVPLRSEASKDAGLATALATVAAAAAIATGATDAAVGLAIGGVDSGNRQYLKTSRRDESIADEWAIKLLDEAQISSFGLADFMRRLAGQRALPQTRQSVYYSSHPGAAERLSTFNDHMQRTKDEDRRLNENDLALLSRLVLKLSAYVYPAERNLKTPFEVNWPRSYQDNRPVRMATSHINYATAITYYRRGDLDKAKQMIDTILQSAPEDSWFLEFAGDIHMSRAEPEKAIEFFQRALAGRPEDPLLGLSLGRALIASNKPQHLKQAVSVLEKALEKEPNWAFVKRQLAIAYGRTGKLHLADILLAEEALLKGDTQRAITLATRLARTADMDKAVHTRALDILFELNVPPPVQ